MKDYVVETFCSQLILIDSATYVHAQDNSLVVNNVAMMSLYNIFHDCETVNMLAGIEYTSSASYIQYCTYITDWNFKSFGLINSI